jgi:hypothetical protein
VKQGCVLSPTGFQLASDRVVRNVLKVRKRGIRWGLNGRLEDLDFADNICLLSARFRDMEIKITKLREEANNGRKINAEKTKEMGINSNKKKGKKWPKEFQEVKVPRLHDNGTGWWKGCQPYSPAAFTPRKCSWYSFLLEAESSPGP